MDCIAPGLYYERGEVSDDPMKTLARDWGGLACLGRGTSTLRRMKEEGKEEEDLEFLFHKI